MNDLVTEFDDSGTEAHAAIEHAVIPVASPIASSQALQPLPEGVAHPHYEQRGLQQPFSQTTQLQHPYRPPTDRLAIVSAICGFTAIVPVVSQVVGLVLGIASLIKIRRARKQGLLLGGTGWAWTGVVSSSVTLIGWVLLFAAFAVLGSSLVESTGSLQSVLESVR